MALIAKTKLTTRTTTWDLSCAAYPGSSAVVDEFMMSIVGDKSLTLSLGTEPHDLWEWQATAAFSRYVDAAVVTVVYVRFANRATSRATDRRGL